MTLIVTHEENAVGFVEGSVYFAAKMLAATGLVEAK